MRISLAPIARVAPAAPLDGAVFCAGALRDIAARVARGERCVVVFDLDNTLVDTRHRTLRAVQQFGREHGIAAMARANVRQMGVSAADTCRRLGLREPAQLRAFETLWQQLFWDTRNWRLDRPVLEACVLAQRARAAGAEVVYLTGRIDHAASVAQVRALGLPLARAANVVVKPAVGSRTDAFKRQHLAELARAAHIGWFMTEGGRDLAALLDLGVPLVRAAFPGEPDHPGLPPTLPLLSLPSLK